MGQKSAFFHTGNYLFFPDFEGANEFCVVPTNETNEFLGKKRCYSEFKVFDGYEYKDNCTDYTTPATQFWERYVLNITADIGEPGNLGGFNYPLPLALLLSWIVVFLCLMKGVKSSGKVRTNHKTQFINKVQKILSPSFFNSRAFFI